MTPESPSGVFVLPLVLFPTEPLTLRIFEARYHQLIRDCDRNEGRFVIVDKGDIRVVIPVQEPGPCYGTRVRIATSGLLPTGDRIVEVVGEEKVSVTSWLPDDPYPVALVVRARDMDEPEVTRLGELESYLKHGIRLAIEMGAKVSLFDSKLLPVIPAERLWALCALAPLIPEQRKTLLDEPFGSSRLEKLGEMVAEQVNFYERMLGIR